MTTGLEVLFTTLSEWEQETVIFLSERVDGQNVDLYVKFFEEKSMHMAGKDLQTLMQQRYGLSASLFQALSGLSMLRGVLTSCNLLLSSNTSEIPSDYVSDFTQLSFFAGILIGGSNPVRGMEVLEWEIHRLQDQQRTAGKEARRESSKKATDVKYLPGRDLYNEAQDIARSMWVGGSPLKHHEMKRYLIKEYQVAGKCPFAKFDANCGYTEKGLLNRLKKLAEGMKRPDLISGQKKLS